jgi:hypothetical protein
MKKILLSIVILFTITTHSQDLGERISGIWSSDRTDYYVIILYNENKDFEFINFSLKHGKSIKETVIEKNSKFVKTKLSYKPEMNWEVFITYTLQGNSIYCKFEGSLNEITRYDRYTLHKTINN